MWRDESETIERRNSGTYISLNILRSSTVQKDISNKSSSNSSFSVDSNAGEHKKPAAPFHIEEESNDDEGSSPRIARLNFPQDISIEQSNSYSANSRRRNEKDQEYAYSNTSSLNNEQKQKRDKFMQMLHSEQTHFESMNLTLIVAAISVPLPLFYLSAINFENKSECSSNAWITFGSTLLGLLLVAIIGIIRARVRSAAKKEVRFYYTESDSIMDIDTIMKLSFISFMCGGLSSILGITSYWLYSGALERYGKTITEAQVTSLGLIMLGSLLTGLEYHTKFIISIDYTIAFIVICIVALFLALLLKSTQTRKEMKRPSIFLFLTAVLSTLILIALITIVVLRMFKPGFEYLYLRFGPGCTL